MEGHEWFPSRGPRHPRGRRVKAEAPSHLFSREGSTGSLRRGPAFAQHALLGGRAPRHLKGSVGRTLPTPSSQDAAEEFAHLNGRLAGGGAESRRHHRYIRPVPVRRRRCNGVAAARWQARHRGRRHPRSPA